MEHHIVGPFAGVMIVMAVCVLVTLVCLGLALSMLLRPGESRPDHPKYGILRHDR
jgi:hypothetical protein